MEVYFNAQSNILYRLAVIIMVGVAKYPNFMIFAMIYNFLGMLQRQQKLN